MSDLQTVTVESDHLVLDQILWRKFRRKTPGLLEQTLELNPGLAGLGPVIPRGTVILIPDVPPATTPRRKLITLWD